MLFNTNFKKWAEQESLRLRLEMGLKKYSPLPAHDLLEFLQIPAIPFEEIEPQEEFIKHWRKTKSHLSAFALNIFGDWIICHDNTNSSARQESDIMHEIAHILCDHKKSAFQDIGGVKLKYHDKEQERQAEWLGSCLQIPKDGIISLLYKGLNTDEIARHFNASIEMANFRVNKSGAKIIFERSLQKTKTN